MNSSPTSNQDRNPVGWIVEEPEGRSFFWKEETARHLAKLGGPLYNVAPLYRDAGETSDVLMLRSVGAMAIAEGQEGWEKIPIDCPMLGAVVKLRRDFDALATTSQDAKDAARFRFVKGNGWPKATRAGDGSRLWYMDRASDNVEMVDPTFDGCIDKAMGSTPTTAPTQPAGEG